MDKKLPRVALAATFVIFISKTAAAEETITQDELVRRTQELYDAGVPGSQELWKKYFADDCIFADENGRRMDKTKLVADITPMPKGYSCTIKVVNPVGRIIGDTRS